MIRFDAEKCTACGACAVACMDENDVDVERGDKPFLLVYRTEENGRSRYHREACRHCADAPCAEACPMGCLYKDEATGLTLYDVTACIACGACADACPWDAIGLRGDPPGMGKCHGCYPRITAGLEPTCVLACPTGALRWEAGE